MPALQVCQMKLSNQTFHRAWAGPGHLSEVVALLSQHDTWKRSKQHNGGQVCDVCWEVVILKSVSLYNKPPVCVQVFVFLQILSFKLRWKVSYCSTKSWNK